LRPIRAEDGDDRHNLCGCSGLRWQLSVCVVTGGNSAVLYLQTAILACC
jgi:hypothetical protein